MLNRIHHIGIAVENLEDGISLYRDVLGMTFLGEENVEEQKVRVAMFRVGETRIELLEPVSEDSPIAGFIAKRGPGIHHICYEVDNVTDSLAELKEKGLELIDEHARIGAGGMEVAFLHPRSTGRVLIELTSSGQAGPG